MTLNQRALRRVSAAVAATFTVFSLAAAPPAEAAPTTAALPAATQAQASYVTGYERCRRAGSNQLCLFRQEFYGGQMVVYRPWSNGGCFNLYADGTSNWAGSIVIIGRGWNLNDKRCHRKWNGWVTNAPGGTRMYAMGNMAWDISSIRPLG
jgi:hypothetical protein